MFNFFDPSPYFRYMERLREISNAPTAWYYETTGLSSEWQRCPVCNASGVVQPGPGSMNTSDTCPTCKGNRIISRATGLPPVFDTQTTEKQ